jgi:hypothetical protein
MTDQPKPHDQHDSELQLVLTIGIEGFRELVSWVAEGTTPESRHARGSTVRQVIDDIVKNVDSAKINQALLDVRRRGSARRRHDDGPVAARGARVSSATAGAIHSHHVPLDDAVPKHNRHGAHAGSGPEGAS